MNKAFVVVYAILLLFLALMTPGTAHAISESSGMTDAVDLSSLTTAWVDYAHQPSKHKSNWKRQFSAYVQSRGSSAKPLQLNRPSVKAVHLGDGAAHLVSVPLLDQENRTNCGPASAKMATACVLKQPPAISHFAQQLNTDEGGTSFGSESRWLDTLQSETGFAYRLLAGPAINAVDAEQWPLMVRQHAIATLLANRAAIVDTVQYTNGLRLPGYEGYLHHTWHYLAVVGFDTTNPQAPLLVYHDSNGYNPEAFGRHVLPLDDLAQAASYGLIW